MEALTAGQRKVLAFITREIVKGRPPTIREIGDHLGSTSSNTPVWYLRALERKGYLEIQPGARGIRVLKNGIGR